MKLIDALKEKQGDMTDVVFAKTIGITQPAWSMLKNGLRTPDKDTLGKILTVYPTLADEVFNYLLGRDNRNGLKNHNR